MIRSGRKKQTNGKYKTVDNAFEGFSLKMEYQHTNQNIDQHNSQNSKLPQFSLALPQVRCHSVLGKVFSQSFIAVGIYPAAVGGPCFFLPQPPSPLPDPPNDKRANYRTETIQIDL